MGCKKKKLFILHSCLKHRSRRPSRFAVECVERELSASEVVLSPCRHPGLADRAVQFPTERSDEKLKELENISSTHDKSPNAATAYLLVYLPDPLIRNNLASRRTTTDPNASLIKYFEFHLQSITLHKACNRKRFLLLYSTFSLFFRVVSYGCN